MLCQTLHKRHLTGIVKGPYQVLSSVGFTQIHAATRNIRSLVFCTLRCSRAIQKHLCTQGQTLVAGKRKHFS